MKYADLNKVLKNLSTTVFCHCGHLSFLAFVVVVRCLLCFFSCSFLCYLLIVMYIYEVNEYMLTKYNIHICKYCSISTNLE